ncbi:unnamed protein product [Durusdinium trenchii]|uniref:DNA (cytosine-5-)-methyltransferase n=1 Tax=Durusdinium trenchii TaxID=1381693 RepID=A0ABP0NQE1_9DINO
MFKDITCLKDDAKRRCVCHSRACEIPEIDGFAAGFSCTSYSLLNNNAAKNATGMERARNGDAEGGTVASVSTFQGCVDILEECTPIWALFEFDGIHRSARGQRAKQPEVCLARIREIGYVAKTYLLDSQWYGLPQSRRRVYIVCLSTLTPDVSVSPNDFFQSVRAILQTLHMDPPPKQMPFCCQMTTTQCRVT